jgi:hypothetical protein
MKLYYFKFFFLKKSIDDDDELTLFMHLTIEFNTNYSI